MRIDGLTYSEDGGYQTLSAIVNWEDVDHPPQPIYFRYQTDKSYIIAENYHPFVLASVIPALRYGERRIRIEGAICPWLKDNLETFMAYMMHWYWYKYARRPDDARLVTIEANGYRKETPKSPRTGAFFSAGVDSFYTLRRNQLGVPPDHPGAIKDLIFVHGFDIGVFPARGGEEDFFRYVVEGLQDNLKDTGLNLIPAFTNLRTLAPKLDIWLDEYMGSAMGAVAQGLSGRLSDMLISSSYEIPKLHPFSSHPMIEPRLSAFDLRIHHDGERLSRVERVKLIAQWSVALASLRVCFDGESGHLNCGMCSKCIRTKLELLCVGKLQDAQTFPQGELTAHMIRAGLDFEPHTIAFASTLKKALRDIGRTDLAQALGYKEWRYYFSQMTNWKEIFTSLDRLILRGALKRKVRLSA